jgi:hypothetical protein
MNPLRIGLDVLRTTVSDKTSTVLSQLGDIDSERVDADNVETFGQLCLVARPSKADKGKAAAQCVAMDQGGRLAIIAQRDLRGQQLAGRLAEGEFCLYAPGVDAKSQGRVIGKSDGSITTFTTDTNTDVDSGGKSVYARVAPDGFEWVAPWGTMRFNAESFSITHKPSGCTFDMFAMFGLPAPLDKITSCISLQAGSINMPASATSFGVGVPTPLAGSVAVLAAISGLQAQIAALKIAIAAITAGATNGGTAAIATQAVALAAAAANVSAAVLLIPATTAST